VSSHDDYIIFAAYIILFIVPGAVLNIGVSYCNDLIVKVYAVFAQLEPDLVTLNIDLLWRNCVAFSKVKGLTYSQSVLVIAVKYKLGEYIWLVVYWYIFYCKEAHLWISSIPVIILVSYLLDGGCVYKCIFCDCPGTGYSNGHLFRCYVCIQVVVEACE